MTEIEDRLRRQLPELADRLTSSAAAPAGGDGTDEAPAAEPPSPRESHRRRRALAVAGVGVALAAVAVVAVLLANGSDPSDVSTDSPPTTGRTESTTTVVATDPAVRTVTAEEFGISLQIPQAWVEDSDGGLSRRWRGDDGWVQVVAAQALDGLAGVVDNLVDHRLAPFGSAPSVAEIVVDGAPARLIVPSDDAPMTRDQPEAAIAIAVPAGLVLPAGDFSVLTVYVDQAHAESIAASIRFLPPPPTTTASAAPGPTVLATSPDGRFTYLARYPADNGLNGTLLVDDGESVRPALRDARDEFDRLGEITFGPTDLITWQSDDENYGTKAFLGRIDDGGQIVDSHEITPTAQIAGPGVFDDAGVLTLPTRNAPDARIDPATDPFFVMSATNPPAIDTENPLAPVLETEGPWAVDGDARWYRGETLGSTPACGASTLYKDDPDGYARVLDPAIEVDTVVAVDVTDTIPAGGFDTAGAVRVVVLSTECPEDHPGRRAHWGLEFVDYGDGGPRFERPLRVQSLDTDPIAQVDAVATLPADPDDCCPAFGRVSITLTLLTGEQQVVTLDADDGW